MLYYIVCTLKYCIVADETIEKAIQVALKEGEEKGIKGKEITPFVLSHIAHLTEGLSLQTSILPFNTFILISIV